MKNHILNINDDTKKVVKIKKTKSLTITNQNKKYQYIKNISIYNSKQMEKLIVKKMTEKLKRLKLIIDDISSSDDTNPSDAIMVIDEDYKLQEILKTRYKEYLNKEYYDYFLKELIRMSKQLEEKIIDMTYGYNSLENEEYIDEYENRKGR